jgi:hypothetical protein
VFARRINDKGIWLWYGENDSASSKKMGGHLTPETTSLTVVWRGFVHPEHLKDFTRASARRLSRQPQVFYKVVVSSNLGIEESSAYGDPPGIYGMCISPEFIRYDCVEKDSDPAFLATWAQISELDANENASVGVCIRTADLYKLTSEISLFLSNTIDPARRIWPHEAATFLSYLVQDIEEVTANIAK